MAYSTKSPELWALEKLRASSRPIVWPASMVALSVLAWVLIVAAIVWLI